MLLERVPLQFSLRETIKYVRIELRIVLYKPGKSGLERLFLLGFFPALGLNLGPCRVH